MGTFDFLKDINTDKVEEVASNDAAAAEYVKPRTEVEKRLVRLFSSSSRTEAFSYDEWVDWAKAHGASDNAIAIYWEEAGTIKPTSTFLYLNPEEESTKDETVKYQYIPPERINRQASFGDAGAEMSFTGNTIELRAYLKANCPNFYRNMFVFSLNKPDAPIRDWFGSYSYEYLQQRLADNGFAWTREVVRITNPDKGKNKLTMAANVEELNNIEDED